MQHTRIDERQELKRLVAALRTHRVEGARVGLVLGSGLGMLADRIEKARSIPYGDIEGMPVSGVPGHAGQLVVGRLGGVDVVAQQGRVHLYEGWSAREVTRSMRAFAAIGVESVVLTNAAGGLRREWKPGTLMRVADHINLQSETPLARTERGAGNPYDEEHGRALDNAARELGFELASGVYAGLLGPTYETPAEIRMLAWMGADAVGMSTVLEALAAHASGLRVCAVSCITNFAAGISDTPPNHAEVVEEGRKAGGRFSDLLERAVPRLAGKRHT